MPDRGIYDRSRIDWDRLRKYAKRVARETTLTPAQPIQYTIKTEESVVHTREERTGFLGMGKPRQVQVTTTRPASKTVTAIAPHWCLCERSWHHKETTSPSRGGGVTVEEETHSRIYLVLLTTGELKSAWVQQTELTHWGGGGRSGYREETTHGIGNPTEEDICRLDFERYYREFKERRGNVQHHYWLDRDPGRKLLKHAKGVGVNLALKAILEGRSPSRT